MLSIIVRVMLLVTAAGAVNVWSLVLPSRQVAICPGLICADSDACGDGCQCAPLLGGSLGVGTISKHPLGSMLMAAGRGCAWRPTLQMLCIQGLKDKYVSGVNSLLRL